MSVEEDIHWTLKYYPSSAREGWLFWGNRQKDSSGLILCTDGQILRQTEDVKSHTVVHCRDWDAYDVSGEEIFEYYPIFVKVGDIDILRKLEATKPIVRPRRTVSIWELMDL